MGRKTVVAPGLPAGLVPVMHRLEWINPVERLARSGPCPVVSVVAPAGYGKTTLLSTHLSFPQIAGEMFLSRHTIKSQAMSIYRKLGATSRSQAVGRSRELGLLEG